MARPTPARNDPPGLPPQDQPVLPPPAAAGRAPGESLEAGDSLDAGGFGLADDNTEPPPDTLAPLARRLEGMSIGITGATGFLGTALVERLLRCVPGCRLVLVIRSGRRTPAATRARRELFGNDAFGRLRAQWTDFDAEISRRVTVVDGDVSRDGLGLSETDRRLLAACHTVIHSAARVSFDSPLDAAVEVNLLGPLRVLDLLTEESSAAHLVTVSTAYVAGTRRGLSPEAPLHLTPFAAEADWKAEVASARRARDDNEAESRRPENLNRFARQARDELGAAGTPLLAARAERHRQEWVADQMVEAGRSRARSLGWPDAYAYTKALAERAVAASPSPVPVSVVRPSIIESALADPVPGWIRGFRMAEPVIISYARGLLREFPGIPEGVVDVIPVDLVVAALIAVAALGPDPEDPHPTYHVATGARNPLHYRRLVDRVREYFTEHPLYDTDGQPIVAPEWSFASRGRAQRQLERAVGALHKAESLVGSLPIRGQRAEVTARLEQRRHDAERALEYVRLYGAYAETEATFDDRRLAGLWARLEAADQAVFGFDTSVIDWDRYITEIHLPSVVRQARVRTKGGPREGLSRSQRGRRAVLSPERHLAAFDLENTLIASNVVDSYAWLATRHMRDDQRLGFVLEMFAQAPGLLALDRRDRGDFLRHFYRRYRGGPADRLATDAGELFHHLLLKKSFPAGLRRVREHRRLGHRTVLITGALDFVVEPLRPLFDDVVCARMATRNGRLTGELIDGPPTGEARALEMARLADEHGLDLTQSVAYADSASDLPMLEAVGHPVAVNAEPKLAAIARKRGWHVEHWAKTPGAPMPLLPLAPRLVGARR
ncbi:MAG: HAD-IB family hydrolase [Acidimicrobiales bacterium]